MEARRPTAFTRKYGGRHRRTRHPEIEHKCTDPIAFLTEMCHEVGPIAARRDRADRAYSRENMRDATRSRLAARLAFVLL
jgi:hypothetical protein